jgi:hypothetical protein
MVKIDRRNILRGALGGGVVAPLVLPCHIVAGRDNDAAARLIGRTAVADRSADRRDAGALGHALPARAWPRPVQSAGWLP